MPDQNEAQAQNGNEGQSKDQYAYKGRTTCVACDPEGKYAFCMKPEAPDCEMKARSLKKVEERVDELYEQAREKSKQTGINPKDLVGVTKVPLSLVPYAFVAGAAMGLQVGGVKYGPMNFRDVPVQMHIYVEAALGHMMSFSDGEDIDEESGLCHLYLASACIAIIVDGMVNNRIIDTRHTKGKFGEGTFSRQISKLIGDQEKIKHWLSRPYAKTIGLEQLKASEQETQTNIAPASAPDVVHRSEYVVEAYVKKLQSTTPGLEWTPHIEWVRFTERPYLGSHTFQVGRVPRYVVIGKVKQGPANTVDNPQVIIEFDEPMSKMDIDVLTSNTWPGIHDDKA